MVNFFCDHLFIYMVRFQVRMAASMKMTVFWDVAPCSLVEMYRRIRDAYCLHHQGNELFSLYQTTRRNFPEDSHLHIHLYLLGPKIYTNEPNRMNTRYKETIRNVYTVIPRFTRFISSSKTARKTKTRKTKINFSLLPDGNNDRFARGRSSYERKLAHELKNRYYFVHLL
jgi:hypothetical protein